MRKGLATIMNEVPLRAVDGIAGTFSKGSDAHGSRHTMDYIFVSQEMYLKAGRVGKSRTGSDHYPIEATLSLPRTPR